LEEKQIAAALAGADTLVHLVGVPKPSPAKSKQFRTIDLVSVRAAVAAASRATPRPHFVYLSVAQPAPVMKAYVAVRAEGEALLRAVGLDTTVLRPWYVLGPGHRWPSILVPVYALLERFHSTRDTARRLGFVSLAQMAAALVRAVEQRPSGTRVIEVPEIRQTNLGSS